MFVGVKLTVSHHYFWSWICRYQAIPGITDALQWRHKEPDGVSNHQRLDCLFNRLFRRRSRSKKHQSSASLALWGESTGERFPSQRGSNAEIFPFDDVIMDQPCITEPQWDIVCYITDTIVWYSPVFREGYHVYPALLFDYITNLVGPTMTDWYSTDQQRNQGAVSIRKTVLPGMAIPMLKIRRPNGRLIFNMEITIRR